MFKSRTKYGFFRFKGMDKLPLYKVVLNSEDDGMDFNAFVDYPATQKNAYFFDKQKPTVKHHFNDEKRIVTGVAIAANIPIFRRDQQGNEYNLFFPPTVVREMGRRMMKKGYMHNLNSMHDENKQIKGAFLEEIYYIDKARGHNAPEIFKDQNLQDGTMIVSYFVEDDKEWAKWKNGTYKGFSIEAWFDIEKVNFKNQIQMEKKETLLKRVIEYFTEDEKEEEKTFAETTTSNGEMIKWEGDLTVGTPVMLVTEESDIVASEGTYNLPEMNLVIMVDANGLVSEIEEVTEEPTEEVTEEVIEEMAKQFANQRETFKSEIKSLKATIAEQDKKIANLFELVTGEKKTTTKTTTPTADWKKISLSKTKQK